MQRLQAGPWVTPARAEKPGWIRLGLCSLHLYVHLCVSLLPGPQPIKVDTITCEAQSIPLYRHTVCKTDRKMFCVRQENLLREILWLRLSGSGLEISTVSSVLQISELGSWATEVRVPGFELPEETTATIPTLWWKCEVIKVGSWTTDAHALEILWKGRRCILGPLFLGKLKFFLKHQNQLFHLQSQ